MPATYTGFFALLGSAPGLLWFVGAPRDAMSRFEDEPRSLTALGFSAGWPGRASSSPRSHSSPLSAPALLFSLWILAVSVVLLVGRAR